MLIVTMNGANEGKTSVAKSVLYVEYTYQPKVEICVSANSLGTFSFNYFVFHKSRCMKIEWARFNHENSRTAATHIKRQLISIKTPIRKSKSTH